jgi:sporulation protein YlmC with PRC-barrel domain
MRADITSMLGLDVYTQKGIFVGRVDDAVIDPEQGIVSGLALGNINKELFDQKGKGVVIPYRLVTAIGDIVLMRHLTKNGQGNREDE